LCLAGVLATTFPGPGLAIGSESPDPPGPARPVVALGSENAAAKATASRRATSRPLISFQGVRRERDSRNLAPGRSEKLHMYMSAGSKSGERFPAVVIIHGGGWLAGDKGASREQHIGTTLARAGYLCASISSSGSSTDT
jgi:acetyl esterase/lipase